MEGLLPSEILDARAGTGAPARETVAAFGGRFADEGKREPSVFFRKGLGKSSPSYGFVEGELEAEGRVGGTVEGREGGGRGRKDVAGGAVFEGLAAVSLRRPKLVTLIGESIARLA